MEIVKNKSKVSTVALVLVLTIAATLITYLPAVNAQPPPPPPSEESKDTYAYIGAIPNPVGKGQDVLLHVGITDYLSTVDQGWEDLWVTIEKPDGTTDTIPDIRTDATGGTGVLFTPDQVGTHYLQTHFPEQWWNATYWGFWGWVSFKRLYKSSESEILELVVQEDPVEYYPGNVLPSEYWTRPIDAQLREWSSISGSWPMTPSNMYAPYNDGPETAHILWTKPFLIGGLAGGERGEHSFEIGDAYRGKWSGAIILAGRLYYQAYDARFMGMGPAPMPVVYHCVDLHTGEELWSKTFLDDRTITFGQLMYWDTYNYHAVFAYLWVVIGTTWYAFDAFTGNLAYTMTNVPFQMGWFGGVGAGATTGPNGEFLQYTVNTHDGWMTLWNSTNVITLYGDMDPTSMEWGSWRAEGKTVNATGPCPNTPTTPFNITGYRWNVTIPTGLPGSVQAVLDDRIIGASITQKEVTSWGLSLEPGKEGKSVFNPKTWKAPAEWASGNQSISWAGATSHGEDGVFVLWATETRKYYGFSTETGDFLWETESEHYLNFLVGTTRAIAYDRLFSTGVSGIVYCYNVTTGEPLWTYENEDPYQEFLFANDWWSVIEFITDGKIYLGHEEHSPIDPRPRGAPYYCLDVETGDVVWKIEGAFRQTHWGQDSIIGDSIIATQDTYDQRVYAIGKGPSATTVSIQNDVITQGSSVLIKGMVTDVSPGTEEYALTARFPNGVPAVADEYMSEWMLYVYKQFPAPMDITGVDVLLQAMSSNGTITEIGWVTSDGYGCFSCMWTPPDDDVYTIMAIFMGSKAYWPSYDQTDLGVTAAPEEPAEPAYNTIDLVIIAAVVVAIVIGVVNLLALRKQRK